MTKKTTKIKVKQTQLTKQDIVNGIWELVLIVSMLYAIAIIFVGTRDLILLIPLIPFVLYCLKTVGKRFLLFKRGNN